MPLDTTEYLTSRGWKGKGTALKQGHISRPIAVVQKKTMSGVGKDRDEAVPFWDNIFASAAASIASNTSTPGGSGTSTPTASQTQSAGPSSMSVMARSKKEFARLKLYASFVRGEVIEFKPSDPKASSSGGFGNGAASPSDSATPMHQHKIMKSQLWNVQPVPSSSSTPASPSPKPANPVKQSKSDRKAEKALEKTAKQAKKAEKETRRAEKEAKRVEKEQRRTEKKEKGEAKTGTSIGSETSPDPVKEKKRKRAEVAEDGGGTKEQKKRRKRQPTELEGDAHHVISNT